MTVIGSVLFMGGFGNVISHVITLISHEFVDLTLINFFTGLLDLDLGLNPLFCHWVWTWCPNSSWLAF